MINESESPATNLSYDELAVALEEELDKAKFSSGFIRDWLKKAVETQGAKMVGGGIGMGQADIDIELDGCSYHVSIKPRPAKSA